MANVKVFSKLGQRSPSMSHVQNLFYRHKGFVIRNTRTCIKYESPFSIKKLGRICFQK